MSLLRKQLKFAAKALNTVGPALDKEEAFDEAFAGALANSVVKSFSYDRDNYNPRRNDKDYLLESFKLLAEANAYKTHYAALRRDTPFSCSTEYYTAVATELGFEKVGEFKLDRRKAEYRGPNYPKTETLFVYARPDGLLLTFDTHNGSRNGAHLYYQWKATEGTKPNGKQVNSGFRLPNNVWVGSVDARENLRELVNNLTNDCGKLQSPWAPTRDLLRSLIVEQDYNTLREKHNLNKNDYQTLYKLIDKESVKRLREMPLWVRQMTGLVSPNIRPAPKPQ